MTRRPPISPLSPYTPLSRSALPQRDDLRERGGAPPPATQVPHAAVHGVAPEPEAAEEAAGPPLRRGRLPDAHHLLEEGAGEVELLRLLGEGPDVQAPAPMDRPRVRLLLADQELQ